MQKTILLIVSLLSFQLNFGAVPAPTPQNQHHATSKDQPNYLGDLMPLRIQECEEQLIRRCVRDGNDPKDCREMFNVIAPSKPQPTTQSFSHRMQSFGNRMTERPTKQPENDEFLNQLDKKLSLFSPAMRERIAACKRHYHDNTDGGNACAAIGGKDNMQAVDRILDKTTCLNDGSKENTQAGDRIIKMMHEDQRQQEQAHLKDPKLAERVKELVRVCTQGGDMVYESCDDLDIVPKAVIDREVAELQEKQRAQKRWTAAGYTDSDLLDTPFPMGKKSKEDIDKESDDKFRDVKFHHTFNNELTQADKELIAQMIKEGTLKIGAELNKVTQACVQAKVQQAARAAQQRKQLSRIEQELGLTKYQEEQEELERVFTTAGNIAERTGKGLAFLARALGDKDSARKLKVFGKETHAFINGSMEAFSGDPVMGAFAMGDALMNLIEGMDDDQQDPTDQLADVKDSILAAIEEAIRILSLEMKKNTQEIIGEIRDVKQLVGENHGEAMAEFFKLHASQGDIKTEIHAIRENMHRDHSNTAQTLHQQGILAAQRHEEVGNLFAELPVRQIDTAHHELQAQIKREMNSELLGKIIEKYHFFIKQLASSASLTGSYVSEKNLQRTAEALADVTADPTDTHTVCQHLDLLVRTYETMLKKSIHKDLKEGISNPLILNKCIKQLTHLIEDFLNSGKCVFTSPKDQDLCLHYLTEIADEQERCQKTVAWLLDPKLNQETLAHYKQAIETLNKQIADHHQKEFVEKTREEIKNRLRSIVEVEKGAIQYMIPPQFSKLKGELLAFDSSMTQATESVRDSWAQGSYRPFVSRSGINGFSAPLVQCFFHNTLAGDATLEAEARRDDLSSAGIEQIIEAKQQHWFKVRQDLLNKIDVNLQKCLGFVDKLNCSDLKTYPKLPITTVHSIVYPAQPDQYHLPLIAPGMLLAIDTAKVLVDTGQATLRYTYAPEGNHLIITAWLKHNDIETENISLITSDHTQQLSSDEDIYNFWYGGRYCKDDQDAITVAYGTAASHCYGSSADNLARHIATHRYPSLIEHEGICTKMLKVHRYHDYDKTGRQQTAIQKFFASKQLTASADLAHQLNDESTLIGKTTRQQNVFYSMLCAALAMYGGTLEPNLAITQYSNGAQTSNQLRQLLTTDPKKAPASLTDVAHLCNQPQLFSGPHKLIGEQSNFLDDINKMLTVCRAQPVVVPPATSAISTSLMDRLDMITAENKKLAAQLAEQKTQNDQILALLLLAQKKP